MKTVVLGASPNSERFSYKAVKMLLRYDHKVLALGKRKGEIKGIPILTGKPILEGIDTISLYLGAKNQKDYYEYIQALQPRRIIFNPGTENEELERLAKDAGIDVIHNCTLVMLSKNEY